MKEIKDLKTRWTKDEIARSLSDNGSGIVIPVYREIRAGQRVLDFHAVEELLNQATTIAAGECDCRRQRQNCDHTLEGCLFLDSLAESVVAEGGARPVTRAEALEILKKTHAEGLVLVSGTEDPPVKICSCCNCCCFIIAGLQQFGYSQAMTRADHIIRLDEAVCTNCCVCVERCHFGALRDNGGSIALDPQRCFGCGLCVSVCPVDALYLTERKK